MLRPTRHIVYSLLHGGVAPSAAMRRRQPGQNNSVCSLSQGCQYRYLLPSYHVCHMPQLSVQQLMDLVTIVPEVDVLEDCFLVHHEVSVRCGMLQKGAELPPKRKGTNISAPWLRQPLPRTPNHMRKNSIARVPVNIIPTLNFMIHNIVQPRESGARAAAKATCRLLTIDRA